MRPAMAEHLGRRPPERPHVVVGPDGHDAIAADRDRVGSTARGVAAPHVGVGDDQVGGKTLCIRHGADPSMEARRREVAMESTQVERGLVGTVTGDEVDIRESGVGGRGLLEGPLPHERGRRAARRRRQPHDHERRRRADGDRRQRVDHERGRPDDPRREAGRRSANGASSRSCSRRRSRWSPAPRSSARPRRRWRSARS